MLVGKARSVWGGGGRRILQAGPPKRVGVRGVGG